jgi:hypothetical protein
MPVETETEERRAQIEDAYNTIFTVLKPKTKRVGELSSPTF